MSDAMNPFGEPLPGWAVGWCDKCYQPQDPGCEGPCRPPPKLCVVVTEAVLDQVDDAIETALLAHEPVIDEKCSCGARQNMDGDVLHSHRLGAVSAAVRAVLEVSGD